MSFLDFIYGNTIITVIFYLIIFILVVIFLLYLYKVNFGNFNEASLFKRLKRLYKEKDYPYIKEIILPLNEQQQIYYDAIVFGDKFIYLIEMKNHVGTLHIDPLNDWYYQDGKNKKISFTNPFYELDVKKHVLNKFLKQNQARYVELVVYNLNTKIEGNKGLGNNLVSIKQLNSFIKYQEQHSDLAIMDPTNIEKMGNYLLSINIKKKKVRYKLINKLKNQRVKK